MQKVVLALGLLIGLFALSNATQIQSQGRSPADVFPPGTATGWKHSEIMTYASMRTGSEPVTETQLGMVSIGGKYNVGVAVMNRRRAQAQSGPEHHLITEVYQIVSGTGTLVTGGTFTPPLRDSNQLLIGPSRGGGPVKGGVSRPVGPGDVIILPPNTPHYFSEISSDEIVYLMTRIDTERVLKPETRPLVYPDDPIFK